jgi:predicted metal-dependent peptidase
LEKIDASLQSGRCFEYYYKNIINSNIDINKFANGIDHEWLEKISNLGDEQLKKITDWLKKNGVDLKDLQKLIKKIKQKYSIPGTEPGNIEKALNFNEEEDLKNTNWQNVLNKIVKRFENQNSQVESWFEQPRRRDWQSDYALPNNESLCDTIAKRNIHIFMDTSGSCLNWSSAFMSSAMAFPKDKFNVFLYNFDVKVYEINKKSKTLLGYGGTSFRCISDYVNNKIKKYDAIIVLTDGYGDYAEYKKPRLWHWVLIEDYKICIPNESKIYNLSDLK